MMQYVATTKSEVAAFTTGVEAKSIAGSELNEPFGKLLQDQKSNNSLAVASEGSPHHSPRKKELQQSPDQGLGDHAKANFEGTTESTTNNFNDELKVGNTEPELALSVKQNDIDSELTIEPDSVVAQEWVALVGNLQKLVDIARLAKELSVDDESKTLDVDLTLSNKVVKGLLEQGAEQQLIDGFNAAPSKSGFRQTGFLGSENLNNEVLVTPDAKEKNQASIAILIQQALEKLTAKAETGQVPSGDAQQKTAELLLEQPEVLQKLLSQLQQVSQKSGTDLVDQKTIDTTIDKVIKKDVLLASQQIQTGEQVDLTLAENNALLRTLLVDSETDKTRPQELVKQAKPVLSYEADKTVLALEQEAPITKLEPVAEQDDLPEQNLHITQVEPNNIPNLSKPEKVASSVDIKNILNLTDNKLDKVLENIAQRVFDSKKAGESSSKDFISALKSGIAEIKNQLSQGREPGMDLKALVADALAKTPDTTMVAKAPINLEQIVNSVSKVLDFAQTMSRAIEHHHDQTYSAILRDVAQIQGEQSKQIQLNQFESKFEKAINIAKPEGHQQLAEKVRWMVNTKNLVAEIRLDPAELGSVHVKVAMSGESATVNFLVQSQQARDAVDNATPRLKEMLAEKGIELGQSSVRQESDGQQGQGDGELTKQGGRGNGEAEDIEVPEQVLAQQNIVNGALGGIDYFV
jgi:flagellar hook-length control protein FliK